MSFKKPAGKDIADSEVKVEFGSTTLEVPMRALAATRHKGKGFEAQAFTWQTEVLAARAEKKLSTPIASLTRKKPKKDEVEHYNVVLQGDKVRLVPWMSAPTEQFGFGEVKPPAKSATVEGEVQWADDGAEGGDAPKHIEVVGFKDSKDGVVLDVVIGSRRATMTFGV